MLCFECGSKIPAGSKYCMNCGAIIGIEGISQQSQEFTEGKYSNDEDVEVNNLDIAVISNIGSLLMSYFVKYKKVILSCVLVITLAISAVLAAPLLKEGRRFDGKWRKTIEGTFTYVLIDIDIESKSANAKYIFESPFSGSAAPPREEQKIGTYKITDVNNNNLILQKNGKEYNFEIEKDGTMNANFYIKINGERIAVDGLQKMKKR